MVFSFQLFHANERLSVFVLRASGLGFFIQNRRTAAYPFSKGIMKGVTQMHADAIYDKKVFLFTLFSLLYMINKIKVYINQNKINSN